MCQAARPDGGQVSDSNQTSLTPAFLVARPAEVPLRPGRQCRAQEDGGGVRAQPWALLPHGPGGQCPLAGGRGGGDEGHARHEADEGLCPSPQSRHFERADRGQARAFGQRTFRHGPQPWTVTVDARCSCRELIPPQERALSPKSLLTDQALLSQGILRGQPPLGPLVPAPAPLWALGVPGRWACRSPASWPSPSPQLSPASRVFTAHTGVCVSPAHSGCRPRQTPAAAPCGWKRRTRPEGQAWSRSGPSGAVVRASLRIGPGLAGQVAREVLWGPPPLPDARRGSGCRGPSLRGAYPRVGIKAFWRLSGPGRLLCAPATPLS